MTTYEFYLKRAMYWCSRREMCTSDIQKRLQEAGVNDEIIKKIISKLVEDNFIDEKRFAHAYVHDKLAFQKWGLAKIEHALLVKKISPEFISKALQVIDKEEYIKKLTVIALQKRKSIKAENEFVRDKKLLCFLASKGVSAADAFKILNKINNKE
ncbi:MAG: hypothetical protein COX07_00270 [Bacteroidetes bacterium CG23_combo_of_CG06-09_8_20_14_all_32_9]|nr:MAG: hypothetical protein COX07_00270 [Bacteroidetes bacterium CG23_combo_of_CG06-09_8_20_14_all_32_9]